MYVRTIFYYNKSLSHLCLISNTFGYSIAWPRGGWLYLSFSTHLYYREFKYHYDAHYQPVWIEHLLVDKGAENYCVIFGDPLITNRPVRTNERLLPRYLIQLIWFRILHGQCIYIIGVMNWWRKFSYGLWLNFLCLRFYLLSKDLYLNGNY